MGNRVRMTALLYPSPEVAAKFATSYTGERVSAHHFNERVPNGDPQDGYDGDFWTTHSKRRPLCKTAKPYRSHDSNDGSWDWCNRCIMAIVRLGYPQPFVERGPDGKKRPSASASEDRTVP